MKVTLDIQRFEFVLDRGVELDVVWRLESRDGLVFFGRTVIRKPVEAGADRYADLVAAERRAFPLLAQDLAKEIANISLCRELPRGDAGDEHPMRGAEESIHSRRSGEAPI